METKLIKANTGDSISAKSILRKLLFIAFNSSGTTLHSLLLAVSVVVLASARPQANTTASFEEAVQAAQQAQVQNDFRGAAEHYMQALKLHPEIAELHANLGLMDYELGKQPEAAEQFKAALRLKPSLFVPNLFLGLEYLNTNKASLALPLLVRAQAANPQDRQAALALGRAQSMSGQYEQAAACYMRAASLKPDSEDVWYGLGISYMNQSEAAASALAKSGKDSVYFRALAAEYLDEKGQSAEAIARYRTLVSEAPASLCSHASLGFASLHTGDLAAGEAEFRTDSANEPCVALSTVGLARVALEQGRPEDALNVLTPAWSKDPKRTDAQSFRIWKNLAAEKSALLEKAIRNSPSDLATALLRARDRGETGDISSAKPAEVKDLAGAYWSGDYFAVATAGERLSHARIPNPAVLYWTTKAARRLAVSALARAEAIAPDSPRIHLILGDLYRQKNKYAEAEDEFQKSLAIQPGNLGGLLGLATTYYMDAKYEPAAARSREALERSPHDPEANLLMAEIQIAQHHYTEAESYLQVDVSVARPEVTARVHAVRGKLYAATERSADAVKELQQALEYDEDGSLHYVLGKQYQKLGDQKAATEALARSRALRSQQR
jgi:tetratricopeptide (TPR) repeat protein